MNLINWHGMDKFMYTIYLKKYAHGFVVLCFVVVMQSFIMNSHEVFIHIHQGWFVGTGAIVRLPQCQWSKPDGYGKISQCITTTKHSKAKTVCIFLGIYCMYWMQRDLYMCALPRYLHIYLHSSNKIANHYISKLSGVWWRRYASLDWVIFSSRNGKLLHAPMLTHCQLDPSEQTSKEF